jgi:YfiH family protein
VALERRTLRGDVSLLVSEALERDGFLAAFTERTGGVSPAPFDTLNCSLVTDDDPDNGRENRRRVIAGIDVPEFATAYQVHGSTVVRVGPSARGAGFDDPGTRIPGADGLATKTRGLPIAVLTADCLPVVLADPAHGAVAVVHAGWRGVAEGILSRAVACFPNPAEVRAVIGPGIGPDHYEVGEDVALAVAAGAGAEAVTVRRGGSLFLDLPGTACNALRSLGVRQIEAADLCTACEQGRFFSHRRDGPSGRQLAVAMRL